MIQSRLLLSRVEFSLLVLEYTANIRLLCSQKFYKLKKESEKLINSGGAAPSIPDPKKGGKKSSTSTTIQHKRKAKDDVTNNLNETSSKRTKKKVQNEVALDNNEHIVEIKSESDADESNDEVLRPVKLNPNDLVMEEEEDEKTAKEA